MKEVISNHTKHNKYRTCFVKNLQYTFKLKAKLPIPTMFKTKIKHLQ